MDLQIAIFCAAVAAVSAIMFYISFSKKPTFEEVKANRRKIINQFQEVNKNSNTDKSKDKKPKKMNNKKNRDKRDAHLETNVEIDNSENETKKENVQAKALNLLNNESKVENVVAPAKEKKKYGSAEESRIQPNDSNDNAVLQPKTNVDINTKESKKKTKKVEKEKEDKKNIQADRNEDNNLQIPSTIDKNDIQQVSKQTLLSSAAPVASNSQPSIKKPSKKKRTELNSFNQIKNDNQAISHQFLMNLIQKAELSGSEIQTLIESLLNKQQDDISEWYGDRQDPVVKLKKQLSDTEQTLKDEKQITIGLQAKLKELRAEMVNDRQIARSAEEQITILQNEIRAITNKLHSINDEKIALSANLQQLQKKINENEMQLQLKEEQIAKLRLTDEKNQENVITLQAQVNQLTTQIQDYVRDIEEYQKMHADSTRAFEGSQFSVQELQVQIKNMERSLSAAKTDIENQTITNNNLFEQNEQLSNQLKTQCQELNTLREKNESLSLKLNSENVENGISNNKQDFIELEERLEEKNNEIDKLSKEVEYSKKIIQDLNNSLVKIKNDYTNNQTLLEKSNNEIISLREKINEASGSLQEDVINQLKNSLSERNKEISALRNEIEISKEKNNALRNKNWKVVDALTKAENALQNKIRHEQNINEKCENDDVEFRKIYDKICKVMKNLYPDLHMECSEDNTDDWLANLEKTVMSRITEAASNKQSLSELQAHNSHLQSLVIRYKGIITEAEKMLNQLQKKVEIEEARWKAKVKSLEETLAKVRSNHSSEMLLQP